MRRHIVCLSLARGDSWRRRHELGGKSHQRLVPTTRHEASREVSASRGSVSECDEGGVTVIRERVGSRRRMEVNSKVCVLDGVAEEGRVDLVNGSENRKAPELRRELGPAIRGKHKVLGGKRNTIATNGRRQKYRKQDGREEAIVMGRERGGNEISGVAHLTRTPHAPPHFFFAATPLQHTHRLFTGLPTAGCREQHRSIHARAGLGGPETHCQTASGQLPAWSHWEPLAATNSQ